MTVAQQTGGCHCRNVRFTFCLDLEARTIRCNCSICTKSRGWIALVRTADFTLEAGSESFAEYRFGAGVITHCFCKRCGVKTHGRIKGDSGKDELIAVAVQCLDLAPDVLDVIPIAQIDGLADRPDRKPEFCAYL